MHVSGHVYSLLHRHSQLCNIASYVYGYMHIKRQSVGGINFTHFHIAIIAIAKAYTQALLDYIVQLAISLSRPQMILV